MVQEVVLILGVGALALGCGSSGSSSGGSGGTAGVGTGGEGAHGEGGGGLGGGSGGQPTCDFTPCGGDPSGTWKLVTFCAPDNTTFTESVTFTSDGKYTYTSSISGNTYSGTWTTSGTKITITVQQSSTKDYCVEGDTMWWGGGSEIVVRERAVE